MQRICHTLKGRISGVRIINIFNVSRMCYEPLNNEFMLKIEYFHPKNKQGFKHQPYVDCTKYMFDPLTTIKIVLLLSDH